MSPKTTKTSTEIRAPETEKIVRTMRTAVSFAVPPFTSRVCPRSGGGGLFRSDECSASVRAWDRLGLRHGGRVGFRWFTPEPRAWQDKSSRSRLRGHGL